MIHHYTNLEVLALILKNRTLRFTRLDQVDDPEEGVFVSNGINLGPYTFVSCWTECEEESIPMWYMYTRKEWGVRLSFEKKGLFKTYIDNVYEINGVKISKPDGPVVSLFSPEVRWKQKGYTPPIITEDYDECHFYRIMQYVDDVRPYSAKSVKELSQQEDDMRITIEIDKVGSYKNKRWAFQKESRFVLLFMPGNIHAFYNTPHYFQEQKRIIKDVINNKELGFSYYDMSLSVEAFEHLVITMSPLCSPAQRVIVESLCEKYAPKAKVVESNLIGKVAK